MTKTALILIPGILTGLLLPGTANAVDPLSPPVAHRGGNEVYVENTRKAWNNSMSKGAKWVETDVRFTRWSDIPMIMHDATVDRTTNGTGTVASKTYTELRKYRTSDGQYIPTLWEFLEDVKARKAKALVELKTVPNAKQWDMLKSRIDGTSMRSKVVVCSFNKSTVKAAKARGYTVAWIDDLGDRSVADIKATGATYYMKNYKSVTAARLAKWKSGGLKVFPWTVNNSADWPRFKNYRLPGVITDKPNAY